MRTDLDLKLTERSERIGKYEAVILTSYQLDMIATSKCRYSDNYHRNYYHSLLAVTINLLRSIGSSLFCPFHPAMRNTCKKRKFDVKFGLIWLIHRWRCLWRGCDEKNKICFLMKSNKIKIHKESKNAKRQQKKSKKNNGEKICVNLGRKWIDTSADFFH